MSETNNIEVGKTYGNIEVLELIGNFEDNISIYKCKCIECGTIKNLNSTDILSYSFPNCDCSYPHKGDTRGKLYFLTDRFRKENKKYYYTCRCLECNWEGDLRADDLRRYKWKTRQCNCKEVRNVGKSETEKLTKEDIAGRKTFDILVLGIDHVIERNRERIWKCKCLRCNKTFTASRSSLFPTKGEGIKCCPECSRKDTVHFYDVLGNTYDNCIVIEKLNESINKNPLWKCKCLKCGSLFKATGPDLEHKRVTMCPDCQQIEDMKRASARKMISFDNSLKKSTTEETHIPKFTIRKDDEDN